MASKSMLAHTFTSATLFQTPIITPDHIMAEKNSTTACLKSEARKNFVDHANDSRSNSHCDQDDDDDDSTAAQQRDWANRFGDGDTVSWRDARQFFLDHGMNSAHTLRRNSTRPRQSGRKAAVRKGN